jgi:hypothetical protein
VTVKLYKVLGANLRSIHGGAHDWKDEPTCKVGGPLVACEHGVHLCRRGDIVNWLGPVICPVTEYEAGGMLTQTDKVVVRSATIGAPLTTWNETTARLFACDVAERAVRLYWTNKADSRPLDAIRVARRFAYGLATDTERDAAGAAAGDGITRRLWEYLDGVVTPESLRPTYEAHNWTDPLA